MKLIVLVLVVILGFTDGLRVPTKVLRNTIASLTIAACTFNAPAYGVSGGGKDFANKDLTSESFEGRKELGNT